MNRLWLCSVNCGRNLQLILHKVLVAVLIGCMSFRLLSTCQGFESPVSKFRKDMLYSMSFLNCKGNSKRRLPSLQSDSDSRRRQK